MPAELSVILADASSPFEAMLPVTNPLSLVTESDADIVNVPTNTPSIA